MISNDDGLHNSVHAVADVYIRRSEILINL